MSLDARLKKLENVGLAARGIRGLGERLRARQAMPRVPHTTEDWQRLAEGPPSIASRIAKRVLTRKSGGLA